MANYKSYFKINAAPEYVYKALTNAATIQLWSGSPATMEPIEGSEFALWEESITGKNLSFIPDRQIVQEWDFGDQEHSSIVSITLHKDKGESTSVELKHTNIPDDVYENIVDGWNLNYFGALAEFYRE
ncbi:MAG: ATPase [Ferruginibacter sp.]|nr:ATPase [Ferruginibacter sp.]